MKPRYAGLANGQVSLRGHQQLLEDIADLAPDINYIIRYARHQEKNLCVGALGEQPEGTQPF